MNDHHWLSKTTMWFHIQFSGLPMSISHARDVVRKKKTYLIKHIIPNVKACLGEGKEEEGEWRGSTMRICRYTGLNMKWKG
jgi:hypothetical protein